LAGAGDAGNRQGEGHGSYEQDRIRGRLAAGMQATEPFWQQVVPARHRSCVSFRSPILESLLFVFALVSVDPQAHVGFLEPLDLVFVDGNRNALS